MDAAQWKRTMSFELDLDNDWTAKFIKVIEQHPALYDKNDKNYSDRETVLYTWSAICAEIIPNWGKLSMAECINKRRELMQKWRNLRTVFRRELRAQSQPGRKRRKYIYFDQMKFLLPIIQRQNESKVKSQQQTPEAATESDDDDYDSNRTARRQLMLEEEVEDSMDISQQQNNSKSYRKSENAAPPHPLPSVFKHMDQIDEMEDDELFLLSLVPYFKKMTAAQKIGTKMEFLAVIRDQLNL